MSDVSITTDGFVVDADVLSTAFGIPPADVPAKLRCGEITSRGETGIDRDAGRWRLTFYYAGRALRIVVDDKGTILSRATFPAHAPKTGPIELATMSVKT